MYQTLIDVADLRDNLDNPDWVIVDCRFRLADTMAGQKNYTQAHIPGAVYAHLDDDLSSSVPVTDAGRHPLPSVDDMAAFFGRIGIDSSKQVVIYDDFKHAFASRMWWMLRYVGHDATAVLNGGWQAWLSADAPTSSETTQPEPVTFVPRVNSNWLVQYEEAGQLTSLIDSRAPERYRGEVEPLDPIAGHIPGAVNHFFAQNLTEAGAFKSADLLRGELGSLLEDKNATFYCGSGVTACVNVLASAYAGFEIPRLYVGSWSEWSRKNPTQVGRGG